MNPLGMNWAESLLQKLLYFMVIAALWMGDITLVPIFDGAEPKGAFLNLVLQFILVYIVTIWFSKLFVTFGRRVR